MLASGRYAMLDDGIGFSLVPWKPLIEPRLAKLWRLLCGDTMCQSSWGANADHRLVKAAQLICSAVQGTQETEPGCDPQHPGRLKTNRSPDG